MNYSRFLVNAQFILSLGLVFAGWKGVWAKPWLWIPLAAGCCVMIQAIWTLQPRNLRVAPEPDPGAKLCSRGIYGLIRHPMYSALLIGSGGFACGAANYLGAVLWLALLSILILKSGLEEKSWLERDPTYAAYRKRTKRFVPFVY